MKTATANEFRFVSKGPARRIGAVALDLLKHVVVEPIA